MILKTTLINRGLLAESDHLAHRVEELWRIAALERMHPSEDEAPPSRRADEGVRAAALRSVRRKTVGQPRARRQVQQPKMRAPAGRGQYRQPTTPTARHETARQESQTSRSSAELCSVTTTWHARQAIRHGTATTRPTVSSRAPHAKESLSGSRQLVLLKLPQT